VSPSLGNFFSSLVAGAVVVLAIGGALVFISKMIELHETKKTNNNKLVF
jgi:hypothetical protein